ncbi:MAG: hypothetical protein ACQEQV_08285, partial [Fibrobacterota bacterium]
MNHPLPVVGLLCREHGLNALEHLIHSRDYSPVHVFTHRKKARFEDPDRPQRPDYPRYVDLCRRYGIPLTAIDRKADTYCIQKVVQELAPDLLVSVSWRML